MSHDLAQGWPRPSHRAAIPSTTWNTGRFCQFSLLPSTVIILSHALLTTSSLEITFSWILNHHHPNYSSRPGSVIPVWRFSGILLITNCASTVCCTFTLAPATSTWIQSHSISMPPLPSWHVNQGQEPRLQFPCDHQLRGTVLTINTYQIQSNYNDGTTQSKIPGRDMAMALSDTYKMAILVTYKLIPTDSFTQKR